MSNLNLYETGAEDYANIIERRIFLPPAKEVVNIMSTYCTPFEIGLDIGTGTGVLLSEAKKRFGKDILLVGLDSSKDMLQVANKRGFKYLIHSKLPDMPLADNTFDFVTANFVVAHIKDTQKLVVNIHKVLKDDCPFVFTSWGKGNSQYNEIWKSVLYEYLSEWHVKKMLSAQIPHEEKFGNRNTVITELEKESKFSLSKNYHKKYSETLSLKDYLACRFSFLIGRYLKEIFSEAMWETFTDKMYNRFLIEFGETIEMEHTVNFFAFTCKKKINGNYYFSNLKQHNND